MLDRLEEEVEDEPSLQEEDMVELEEAVVEPRKVVDRGDMTIHNAAPDELEEDLTSDPFDDSLNDPDYQEEVRGQVLSSSDSNQELEESFPAFMEEGRKRNIKRQDSTGLVVVGSSLGAGQVSRTVLSGAHHPLTHVARDMARAVEKAMARASPGGGASPTVLLARTVMLVTLERPVTMVRKWSMSL